MKRGFLNRNQIKYLVIVTMLIDHIAWAWVPTYSVLGQAMHFIGRLAGPTMAYFVADGYLHTRNVKKYALRLFFFALLSWPAFCLFEYGVLPFRFIDGYASGSGVWCFYLSARNQTMVVYPTFGVIYTLFLALLAVWLYDSDWPRPLKLLGILGLLWLSGYGDWQYFDVIWALLFFVCRDKPGLKWGAYCVTAAFVYLAFSPWQTDPWMGFFQLGVYLVPLLLGLCYNGQSGSKKAVHKWFFYVFYPAHLLLLGLLKLAL